MTIVSRTSWCNTRARDPWLGTFVCLRCHRVRFVPGLVSKHPAFVPVGRVEGVWFVFNCYVRKHGSYCGFNCIEFVTVGGVNLDGVGRACSLGLLQTFACELGCGVLARGALRATNMVSAEGMSQAPISCNALVIPAMAANAVMKLTKRIVSYLERRESDVC